MDTTFRPGNWAKLADLWPVWHPLFSALSTRDSGVMMGEKTAQIAKKNTQTP